jgi:hypothetical protein
VYGAAAIQVLSWRWIFLLNVPASLILVAWLMRRWQPDAGEPARRQVDWPGALTLGLALCLLTVAASQNAIGAIGGYGRPLLLILGAIAVLLFLRQEQRVGQPMLPPWLALNRAVACSLLTHLLAGGALMVPLLIVPLWGNTLLGEDATQSALLLARLTLTIPVGALVGSKLPARTPLAVIATIGMLLTAGALAFMASWSSDTDAGGMTPALLLAGFGFGLMIAPTNAAAIETAGASSAATAAGLVQAARLAGMTVASAWLATYGLEQFNARVAEISIADPTAYIQAVRASAHSVFTDLLRAGAVLAVLGAAASLGIRTPSPPGRGSG